MIEREIASHGLVIFEIDQLDNLEDKTFVSNKSETYQFDFNAPKGIYILEILSKEESHFIKLIKN